VIFSTRQPPGGDATVIDSIGKSIMGKMAKAFLVPHFQAPSRFQRGAWTSPLGRVLLRAVLSYTPTHSLIRPGETALFGGMWRTETLVKWSTSLGPEGRLLVAEADGQNAAILEIEAGRRNLGNVRVINKALYRHPGEMKLQTSVLSARNKLMNISTFSPRNPDENYDKVVTVGADTVDNLLADENIDHLHHLHLTVSGAELEVLEGARNTIEKGDTRIFARAILLRKDSRESNRYAVEAYLKERGMYAIHSRKEPKRDFGGNVYAVSRRLFSTRG
jgi:FkbM family methyltransferase